MKPCMQVKTCSSTIYKRWSKSIICIRHIYTNIFDQWGALLNHTMSFIVRTINYSLNSQISLSIKVQTIYVKYIIHMRVMIINDSPIMNWTSLCLVQMMGIRAANRSVPFLYTSRLTTTTVTINRWALEFMSTLSLLLLINFSVFSIHSLILTISWHFTAVISIWVKITFTLIVLCSLTNR